MMAQVFLWVAIIAFGGRLLMQLVLTFSKDPNAAASRFHARLIEDDHSKAASRIASLLMAGFWLGCILRFWSLL